MGRKDSDATAVESLQLLETGTDRSLSCSQSMLSSDDEDYLTQKRDDKSSMSGLMSMVGMSKSRRRRESSLPSSVLRKAALDSKGSSTREARSCRKSHVCKLIKRVLLAMPILTLMGFGVLHVIQAIVGPSSLLLNVGPDPMFMPSYGKPGFSAADVSQSTADLTKDVLPIRCHSHNDYWRRVPLFEALHWGCTGVEADVHLYDEELYVGHSTASLKKAVTLRSSYLEPLVTMLDRINQPNGFTNATGRGVFDEDPDQSLILLIDFKTEAKSTFAAVSHQLQILRDKNYITHHNGTAIIPRAVTIVGTGNTPFDLVVANTTYRDIFFDAPLDRIWQADPADPSASQPARLSTTGGGQGTVGTDANTSFNATNSYYASVSFAKAVGFVWLGRPSRAQMSIIRGMTRGAHARGLKVRWWDTPNWPVSKRNKIWGILVREGADMLNVDDLKAAATEDWRRRVHSFFG